MRVGEEGVLAHRFWVMEGVLDYGHRKWVMDLSPSTLEPKIILYAS